MDACTKHSILGVVGDVRRDMEGHHYAEKCSVFGLDAAELAALQRAGLVTRPRSHELTTDRYQVRSHQPSCITAARAGPCLPLHCHEDSV